MKTNIKNIINHAIKFLEKKDIQGCIDFLSSINVQSEDGKQIDLDQLILILVQEIKNSRISNATTLCEWYLENRRLHKYSIKLQLAQLYDRSGRQADTVRLLGELLAEDNLPPQIVIPAANLLIRFQDKYKKISIDSIKIAFEKSGKSPKQLSAVIYAAQAAAEWDYLDELMRYLNQEYINGKADEIAESPRTHVLWCDDEEKNIQVIKSWKKNTFKNIKPSFDGTIKPLSSRKIKVGYLSSDFRSHPTSRLINGLFRYHDKTKFELYMYCSGWDDKSEMRKTITSHFDHIYTLAELSDEESAKLIKSHEIDILVELNGPTRSHRLGVMALKPAPVLIDYLGWPGTIGGDIVDFIVSDSYTIKKENRDLYPEKLIQLSTTYQMNDHYHYRRNILEIEKRIDHGLPPNTQIRVLGMFNAINKVSNACWSVWMEILKNCPDTIMWILDPGAYAKQNIIKSAKKLNVKPNRIIFAPRMNEKEHLLRLSLCDLILDPWPYGGHTSTSDALFAGVPVIALQGNNFASRVNGSLLNAARLESLIAKDTSDYINLAVNLINDQMKYKKIKDYLTNDVMESPLFNSRKKTKELEAAYEYALQRAIDKKPQKNILFK